MYHHHSSGGSESEMKASAGLVLSEAGKQNLFRATPFASGRGWQSLEFLGLDIDASLQSQLPLSRGILPLSASKFPPFIKTPAILDLMFSF